MNIKWIYGNIHKIFSCALLMMTMWMCAVVLNFQVSDLTLTNFFFVQPHITSNSGSAKHTVNTIKIVLTSEVRKKC